MDILAGVFELIGMYLVGNKNRYGFILSFCCCGVWIAYALTHHVYGLLFPTIPGLLLAIRNYRKWRPKKEED
jgi:hypothetical protein